MEDREHQSETNPDSVVWLYMVLRFLHGVLLKEKTQAFGQTMWLQAKVHLISSQNFSLYSFFFFTKDFGNPLWLNLAVPQQFTPLL